MERLHMNVLMDVVSRLRRGQSVRGVARDLRLCRNTVKKYRDVSLARGYLDGDSPLPGLSEFEWVSAVQCRVGSDCHVTVEGSYYSVPHRHARGRVDVYVGRRIVEIYTGTVLLATHERASGPGQRTTRLEHYPEGKRARLENTPERCLERADGVGEACGELVAALLSDHVLDRLGGVQGLLRLGEKHGNDRLEAACRRALHFGDGTYRRVKTILAAGLDTAPLEEHGAARVAVTGEYRYARPAASFFEGGWS